MRLILRTFVLAALCAGSSSALAQEAPAAAADPIAPPAAEGGSDAQAMPAESAQPAESAPTPAPNLAVLEPADDERAPSAAPAAASAPDSGGSDSKAGWMVIGIGGSMAAANIAIGVSMFAQAGSHAEERVGSATLTGGITGLALSLLVGVLML